MRQYQSLEVVIVRFNELDVITASGQGTNVTLDYFNDSWWSGNEGGNN